MTLSKDYLKGVIGLKDFFGKPYNIKLPPMPPPIEEFRISKEKAIEISKEARQKLFETERGKTYYAIEKAAEKGSYYLEYKYPENCNSYDIVKFGKQLMDEGYEVKYASGLHEDKLTISWYPSKD